MKRTLSTKFILGVALFAVFLAGNSLYFIYLLEKEISDIKTEYSVLTTKLDVLLNASLSSLKLLSLVDQQLISPPQQLNRIKENVPYLEDLTILNPKGRVVNSTNTRILGMDLSHDPSFLQARFTPKVLNASLNRENPVLMVILATPLVFGKQEVGVLKANLNLTKTLQALIDEHSNAEKRVFAFFGMNRLVPSSKDGADYTEIPEHLNQKVQNAFSGHPFQGVTAGLTKKLVIAYSEHHKLSKAVFWIEKELDLLSLYRFDRFLFITLLTGLVITTLLLIRTKEKEKRLQEIQKINQLILNINYRKVIESFPNLGQHELNVLIQSLEKLYFEHFAIRRPMIDNQTFFERLIEHSADFILLTNFSGKIQYVSPNLFHRFFLKGSDFLDHPITEVMQIPSEEWSRLVNELMLGKGLSQYVYQVFLNGITLKLDARLSLIPGFNDSEPMIVMNVRDITEQEILEKALQRKEKLNSLSQFSSGVAHDFSNLLMNIMGYLSVAQMKLESGDSQVLEELKFTQKEIIKAREFILSLIDVSQGGIYHFVNTTVSQVVSEVWQAFIQNTKTKLQIEGDLLIQAYVDPEKLKTILTEVFDNAIYFMSNSGVLVVHISTEKRSHPAEPTNIQPWVRVNVIDSGPGIPEDHLRKVFEPYVTTRGERRGLGLSMVHAVVEAMHGWVDIHSRHGMGTTVSLYLRPAQEPPQ